MASWPRPIVALLVCAAVIASPSVAEGDTSFQVAVGDLAAGGDVLVWSPGPFAPPGPLMAGFASASAPLPVSSFRLSGMDVGTDARGRTVLVYSACRGASNPCRDVYLYDFASGSERRLSSVSRRDCAEGSPQISRGVIVFTRSHCGRGFRAGLYLKRPGKRVRRLTELPPPTQEVLQHRGIASFDLDGRTLALVLRRVGDELPIGSTWRVITQVRVLRLGQRQSRRLASARKLESPASIGISLGQVRLDEGFAYWTRDAFNSCSPDTPGRQDIMRRPIDGSRRTAVLERESRLYAQPECDTLGTYAVTGGRLYYTFNDPQLRPPNGPDWPPNAIGRADGPLIFR
jgi:hypothetical protein